jgi:molybdopterin/thiamine biosynthesis adenylyltransferase
LSGDDFASARELLPRFQMVLPDRPHGSVVFAKESAAGLVALPNCDEFSSALTVRCIQDGRLATWPLPRVSGQQHEEFLLRPIADSRLIRQILRGSVVAVTGLSGGGSQVAAHLAAMGVGEIIGIDPQCVDRSNMLATPHLGWIEAKLGIHKVTAARWRAWLTNRQTKFTGLRASLPEPAALEALKRADIIVGCVNNLHARADLNEIAWRHCIPLVDIGMRITTDSSGRLTGVPGQRSTVLPGGPCLWCTDFLTDEKLRGETGGRGRSYLQGPNDRDALVSCFNGVLAGEAAAEVLRLLSGLGGDRDMRLQYDGQEGVLRPMVVKPRKDCPLCTDALAAGDPIWNPLGG